MGDDVYVRRGSFGIFFIMPPILPISIPFPAPLYFILQDKKNSRSGGICALPRYKILLYDPRIFLLILMKSDDLIKKYPPRGTCDVLSRGGEEGEGTDKVSEFFNSSPHPNPPPTDEKGVSWLFTRSSTNQE